MTVNKAAIEKWAEALESGEYKQVNGKLSDGEGFCCLGVLCEIAVAEGVIEPAVKGPEHDNILCNCGDHDAAMFYDGVYLTPSAKVADWAFGDGAHANPELDTGEDAPLVDDDEYSGYDGPYPFPWENATSLNDGHGWTFPQIAAAVRRTFLAD
jgi:hypothetical protein